MDGPDTLRETRTDGNDESFSHRGLKRLYLRGDRSAVGADKIDKIEPTLTLLDAADRPDALDLPAWPFTRSKVI